MEKFITNDGNEVTFGDLIKWQTETTEDGYYCKSKYAVTLTEETVGNLIEEGVIKPIEEKTEKRDYFNEAINAVFKRMQENRGEAFEKILATLILKYPGAATNMLLRELSIIFNEEHAVSNPKYYEKVYSISLTNGNIFEIPTNTITSWDMFAAFISKEDAEKAKSILLMHEQKD